MHNKRPFLARFGPGLLYAGAAVGVSHLVQSTKAGAVFGYGLVWAVLAANVLKYPFFEFGPRYAAATGKSLLHGYRLLGKAPLLIFMCMTVLTMFIIQAAITLVTAGLALHLTGSSMSGWLMSAIILGISVIILGVGKFKLLNNLMKVVIVLLSVTTLICVAAGLSQNGVSPTGNVFDFSNGDHIALLIGLMGWMPAPLDISVWHSVWSTADNEEKQERTTVKAALFDFKIGYWGTMILAFGFLLLGAITFYGTSVVMEGGHVQFAGQLIQIYAGSFHETGADGVVTATTTFGSVMYVMVAIAALTTMFSTTLTCLDAYPRVLTPSVELLTGKEYTPAQRQGRYWIWIIIVALGTVSLLTYLHYAGEKMSGLVQFITILSFMLAPVIALFNYLVVTSKHMPEAHRPGLVLKVLSWIGMVFLIGFSVWYFVA